MYGNVYGYITVKVSTTFAPAENSTFALNGCGLCMYSVTYNYNIIRIQSERKVRE